jgi:hypothetical protein
MLRWKMKETRTDDWRLTGQERYLKEVSLRLSAWVPQHPENDHDHCAFCWKKFASESVYAAVQRL